MLSYLWLSKPPLKLPLSIQIGDSKSLVVAKVGKPDKIQRNQIVYENNGDGYPHTVSFHFRSDHLNAIEWSFWID